MQSPLLIILTCVIVSYFESRICKSYVARSDEGIGLDAEFVCGHPGVAVVSDAVSLLDHRVVRVVQRIAHCIDCFNFNERKLFIFL